MHTSPHGQVGHLDSQQVYTLLQHLLNTESALNPHGSSQYHFISVYFDHQHSQQRLE